MPSPSSSLEWWPLLRRVLYNPITSLIVGVLGGWFFWWLSVSEIEPFFRVSLVEVVARRESPRLMVLWDNKPVDNLCVCRIGFWNEGNSPITQDKLPASDPLRIVPSKQVNILATEITNVSRPNLRVETRIVKDHGNAAKDVIRLEVVGGDALEKMDGVGIRAFFSGDCTTDFSVEGRVIGVPDGFKRLMPDEQTKRTLSAIDLLPLPIAILLMVAMSKWGLERRRLHGTSLFLVTTIMTVLFGFVLGMVSYVKAHPSSPKWLPF